MKTYTMLLVKSWDTIKGIEPIFLTQFNKIIETCTDRIEVVNNMIPVCRDEISTCPAANFTLRLHAEIKFSPSKAGQFSNWYLFRFVYIFFQFFFVSMY